MCNRYLLLNRAEELARLCGLEDFPDEPPRYNLSPGQWMWAVVKDAAGKRRPVRLRWGVVLEGGTGRTYLCNARAETAHRLPLFRDSFAKRRCLVPADGFYEWAKHGRFRQPYLFQMAGGSSFCFAGLWSSSRGSVSGEAIESGVILTTAPNELVRPIHDRMPLILPPDLYEAWLDPETKDLSETLAHLDPFPAARMQRFAVSTYVNSSTHEGPKCIEPIPNEDLPPTQLSLDL
jgi:putative SOS response-associated peptidase YedK